MIRKSKKNEQREKLTLKGRITEFLENKTFVIVIWAIVLFLSSLITIYQGSRLVIDLFNNTIGEKKVLYNKLSLLTSNVNISYFIEKIGKPSIAHNQEDRKEFIFIDENYYVQAVTDFDDMVMLFSITSRKNNFRPKFKIPGYDPKDSNSYIILNKTTFSDVFETIKKYKGSKELDMEDYIIPMCYAYLGAHRFTYYEGEFLANPGNYQSFYIGVNDAGYYVYNEDIGTPGPWSISNIDDCLNVSKVFRDKQTINTYVETTRFAFMPGKTNDFPILEDDEVRVVDKK